MGLDEVTWPEEQKSRFESDHEHGWATHLGRLADVVLDVEHQEHARP